MEGSTSASSSAVPPGSLSPAVLGPSTGAKRKRGDDVKYYSVRAGHKPGIYDSWKDCLAQVKGFKKATFKKFSSRADAELFLDGYDPSQPPNVDSQGLQKFYAVRSGHVPGVYTDWTSVQRQITGWTKPKHRSFSTRAQAQAFVDGEDVVEAEHDGFSDHGAESLAGLAGDAGKELGAGPPATKRARKNGPAVNASSGNRAGARGDSMLDGLAGQSFELGTGPLPLDAEDGFDPNITLNPVTGKIEMKSDWQRQQTRKAAQGLKKGTVLPIYTDGSSLGNGRHGAVSGVGVYFGDGDDRNVSEALVGPRQTNQRAELTAVARALEIAPSHREVCIYTDSSYSIKCVTEWYVKWRQNSWKTSAGKSVENKDLIEDVLAKIEERTALGVRTNFQWIKGHADDPGNVAADRLAVKGARNATG